MVEMSDCTVRFVKIDNPYATQRNMCKIEFLHNDKIVPIKIDGFLRVEMREINNDFLYFDRWIPYEFEDGFAVISLAGKMLSNISNTLFKVCVHYPYENERTEETQIQRLDSALTETDFKISYNAKDVIDAIVAADTDLISMFNVLTEFGMCMCDDYGNMKNTGAIIKELACKLKALMN